MSESKEEFIPLNPKNKHVDFVLFDKKNNAKIPMTLEESFENKKFTYVFKDKKDKLVISRLRNGKIGFSKKNKDLDLFMILDKNDETSILVKDLHYGLEQKLKLRTISLVDELPHRVSFSYAMIGDKNEVIDEFSMEVREEK